MIYTTIVPTELQADNSAILFIALTSKARNEPFPIIHKIFFGISMLFDKPPLRRICLCSQSVRSHYCVFV